jgi:predicted choloylglycine hydrolase
MVDTVTPADTPEYAATLEQPITLDEIVTALKRGGSNKAPEYDGICLGFYTAHWDTIRTDLQEILNQVFNYKKILPQQKHGIIASKRKW